MVDADGNVLVTDVFGWPGNSGGWWLTPRTAFDSPLPMACRYESEPFWCNEEGIHSTRPNSFLKGIDLTDFERRTMVTAAIVAPVHLPFGQIGAVLLSPRDRTYTDLAQEFEDHGAVFGLFARTFLAGYVAVMTPAQRLPARPQLLKREVECLRWVAQGKSDNEIGILLSITRSTVRFHITRAMVKLDAVNRAQATLKATQLGYIKSA
jgi:DNA-binding CsgD family transcriptional regulator